MPWWMDFHRGDDGWIHNVCQPQGLNLERDKRGAPAREWILVHHPWKHHMDVETGGPLTNLGKMDVRNGTE